MPPFRPPKERIDAIAERVVQELSQAHGIEVVNPGEVRAIVRGTLTDNLREEHDLEQEVMETLHRHGQQIYEENADFQRMLHDGKKILAKKKGFTL